MLNRGYTYHDRISGEDAGTTVLEYYLRHYSHSTAEDWQQHCLEGYIILNKDTAAADSILRAGDRLEYHRPPWIETEVPKDIPVLAEADGWMVFSKPSGLPVLPGGGYLLNTMLHVLRERHATALAPVHRLGRGTSGAMLFSRNAQAAAFLAEAMRERRILKTYLALVQGVPRAKEFTVDVPIGRVAHPLLGEVFAAADGGKESVSHCRVLRSDTTNDTSLLEVRIPTGRPHQIRIHCAAAGHPLEGDPLYEAGGLPFQPDEGRMAVPGDGGYLLHSWHIAFPDPVTGEQKQVSAPPPEVLTP